MDPFGQVGLSGLMALTRGSPDVVVGLIDSPVSLDHPDLATGNVRPLIGDPEACHDIGSASCRHGMFVAGILAARRGSEAPAIAPSCTLLARPVFSQATLVGELPSANPRELAEAIVAVSTQARRFLT